MSSKAMKTNPGLGKMYDVRRYTAPHTASKRIRKKTIEKNTEPNYIIHFNGVGLLSAAIVVIAAPLPTLWKAGLVGLFLLTGINVHTEDD